MPSKKINKPNSNKVLILVRSLAKGGAERQAIENAICFKEIGKNPTICCFYNTNINYTEIIPKEIDVIVLCAKKRAITLLVIRFILLIFREKFEIIYTFTGVPNILGCLKIIFSPSTKLIWGKRATKLRVEDYSKKYKLEVLLERKLRYYPDLIVSNSVKNRQEMIEDGFDANKITVHPNAINIDKFKITLKKPNINVYQIRPDHGAVQYIACVARLDPMKGHEMLLCAFSLSVQNNQNLRLVIVGSDQKNMRDKLKSLCRKMNIEKLVDWIDHIEDLENFYPVIDALILPSLYGEGFPNVVAEAMACGVPCVVTDTGDAKVIVGNHGITVEPGNIQELSDAICKVSGQVYDKNKIRSHIVESYTRSQLTKNLKDLL